MMSRGCSHIEANTLILSSNWRAHVTHMLTQGSRDFLVVVGAGIQTLRQCQRACTLACVSDFVASNTPSHGKLVAILKGLCRHGLLLDGCCFPEAMHRAMKLPSGWFPLPCRGVLGIRPGGCTLRWCHVLCVVSDL